MQFTDQYNKNEAEEAIIRIIKGTIRVVSTNVSIQVGCMTEQKIYNSSQNDAFYPNCTH